MVKNNYNRMDAIGSNHIMNIKKVRCILIFGEHGKTHVVSRNILSIILRMNNVRGYYRPTILMLHVIKKKKKKFKLSVGLGSSFRIFRNLEHSIFGSK